MDKDHLTKYRQESQESQNNLAMNSAQEDEIESLRAIFCRDNEFIAEKGIEGQLIRVNFDFCSVAENEVDRHSTDGSVSIFLAPEYPQTQQPKINIRCSYLPASVVETIERKIEETAAALQGQSMLLDLCYIAQELLEREIKTLRSAIHKADGNGLTSQTTVPGLMIERHLQKQKDCDTVCEVTDMLPDYGLKGLNSKLDLEYGKSVSSRTCQLKDKKSLHNNIVHKCTDQNVSEIENDSKVVTALLQLDHMRSKHNYIKLIKKWTIELDLTGRLIFCNKLILVLLQGTSQAVREYIVRNRTTNVDVDSKGRACKERMLSVLCEVPVESHRRLSEFCVQELATLKSLQELFQSCTMGDLYQSYVSSLVHIPGSRTTSSKQHK